MELDDVQQAARPQQLGDHACPSLEVWEVTQGALARVDDVEAPPAQRLDGVVDVRLYVLDGHDRPPPGHGRTAPGGGRGTETTGGGDAHGTREPYDDSGVQDDGLRLIFTCCHPALPIE